MPRHRIAVAFALLLGACGGRGATEDGTVPEPVAIAPEATVSRAEPDEPTDGAEPAPGARGADLEVAEAHDGHAPPNEEAHAGATVLMRLFGNGSGAQDSSVMASAPSVRWWILVREPGGAEERYRVEADRPSLMRVFPGEVAGWRCQVQGASTQRNVQITGDTRTQSHHEERILLCSKDGQRRTATARCGYGEDPSGRTPTVTPAELELGDPADPHQVTLSCAPP